jgi:predicted TIM-barrel fold metal-dependent hydrolase
VSICDAHCHFFSAGFFRTLGTDLGVGPAEAPTELPARLGWTPPGDDETLGTHWTEELDRNLVARAMLIASVPGDETSVATAVRAHPSRFVGAFMFNPAAPDHAARLARAFDSGLSTVCLFPAMHGYSLDEPFVDDVFAAAAKLNRVVFVHCGVLSVGARKRLGLPSRFDLRRGDPLAVAARAVRHPSVTVVIPHFGAGFYREALMAADQAQNIVFDTSSSNSWMRFLPGLTLHDVFARVLDITGPERVLFGSDSSFFPRGWHVPVYESQRAIATNLGLPDAVQAAIFGGYFQRIFPIS